MAHDVPLRLSRVSRIKVLKHEYIQYSFHEMCKFLYEKQSSAHACYIGWSNVVDLFSLEENMSNRRAQVLLNMYENLFAKMIYVPPQVVLPMLHL